MGDESTRESLRRDLETLGVTAGNLLFIHSSYKSLGPVAGGAETIIAALDDAVGEEGLVLMPTFTLKTQGREERVAQWDINTSPSTVGYLTEMFRTTPGSVRSDHFCHSVAARGRDAAAFVSSHKGTTGLRSPWDWGEGEAWKDFNDNAPMMRAYHHPQGKVLMLGVDYESSTYCHFVEVLAWNRWLEEDPDAQYRWLQRVSMGAYWDRLGRLARGRVGRSESRLFSIRDFVDALLAMVLAEPDRWDRTCMKQRGEL